MNLGPSGKENSTDETWTRTAEEASFFEPKYKVTGVKWRPTLALLAIIVFMVWLIFESIENIGFEDSVNPFVGGMIFMSLAWGVIAGIREMFSRKPKK